MTENNTAPNELPRVHLSFNREDENVAIVAYTRALKPLADKGLICDIEDDILSHTTYSVSSIDFAVLLISPTYLSNGQDLLQLVKAQKSGKLRLLPVIVRPIDILPASIAYQPNLPGDGRAISDLNTLEQDKLWVELSSVVSSWLQRYRLKKQRVEKPSKDNASNKKAVVPTIQVDFKGDIFISHSHDDGYFAQVLKYNLEERGYRAWIDIDMIEAGTNWKQEIDENIDRSLALILVMSPEAKNSEYVTYEWAFALGLRKPVIPLLLKQTSLHPRLASYHYLNFTNRQACPWEGLIERLDTLHTNPESSS